MPVEPIKPSEVDGRKKKSIPDAVYRAFNELIEKKWNGSSSTFEQNDVVLRIIKLMHLDDAESIYENHWLDIESHYRRSGWLVKYVRPDYTESFLPYFEFSKK